MRTPQTAEFSLSASLRRDASYTATNGGAPTFDTIDTPCSACSWMGKRRPSAGAQKLQEG
jgi:hypothetical protein